jgi:hypothetical protein
MPATTPLKKMIFTNYKQHIPRISIQVIKISGKKEEVGFLYKDSILDSGSNIICIPEDIAESLNLIVKNEVMEISTVKGKKKENVQITNNFCFNIISDEGNLVRYDNERARIAPADTEIIIGTIPIFQDFNVIIKASEWVTVLQPK